jgi:chemotaxis protein MotB
MRRKPKAAKAENHERWLITYADLITLLLVFFIVLYAGSQEDSRKFAILAHGLRSAFNNVASNGGGGNSVVFIGSGSTNQGGMSTELQDFESITAILQRVAQERGLTDRINVRMDADGIVIGLTSDLLFDSGNAAVRPEAAPVLAAVADALRGKENEIRVEGHTDNIPINTEEFNSNWELSSARAVAVLRRLIDEDGLKAGKLYAAGYGDTHPRADNGSPAGRAANRRAEIVVIYKPADGAAPATPGATPVATPAGTR